MKPRFHTIAILVLLLLHHPADAQRRSRSGMGYMGGPQLATWKSEAAVYRTTPGFVVGIHAPIKAGYRFELQPELLISLDGMAQDLPDGERAILRSLRAEVPVSLKLFLGQTFNLQAGVQGGYLLLANSQGEDVASALKKLDMGVTVGLGLGTWSGIDLTLRYYNGLSNLLEADHQLFPANRTLQATIGKRFTQFSHRRLRR